MTQEEKDLLLKDLCGRLIYHPRIFGKEKYTCNEGNLIRVTTSGVSIMTNGGSRVEYFLEEIKPYLRPMSSMTEAEKQELLQLMGNGTDVQRVDFYLSHHFDYRGLIPMGLALEAKEGMYGTES